MALGGPLEMGNTVDQGLRQLAPHVTSSISLLLVRSTREEQYAFKELLSARDPWSGWIHYDAGLDGPAALQLVCQGGLGERRQHAGIWRVVAEASATGAVGTNPVNGRNGTPSYLTLAAPDKRELLRRCS
ncbi:MAG: hypothetical protein QM756_33295 [Polyangiaceae bacterium]